MRVAPPLEQFANLDPRIMGWAMSAFYGGRAEARIVRTPVPVVVADFTSMYPAQNALLGTWPLLTADRIAVDDVATAVQTLVNAPNLQERLFDPYTWRADVGVTLVEIDHPHGVVLPVRAGYDPNSRDYGIGVNPLSYDGPLWYALPDVLAAAPLGSAPIIVRRALRLTPVGRQGGLQPVLLRGHRQVDPGGEANPFVAMIEERRRIRRDAQLPAEERDRLDLFVKITANATAYGSLARFDRRDLPQPVPVTVYGPGDAPFEDRTRYPEDPGPYCFPPVAAAITAGARLMLALIERALRNAGGAYAFMDTDSIAIVATPTGGTVACQSADDDTVRALSWDQVRDLLRRFEPLNPYGPDVVNDDPTLGRSPWKVEHASLSRPISCYAIASKRYALFESTRRGLGLVQVGDAHEEKGAADEEVESAVDDVSVDWSEHGLGLYLDPTDDRRRDPKGRRLWVRDAWQWILSTALGNERQPLPAWADRYAVSQFSVSSPAHANWFRLPADGTPAAGKPRPFGFGLLGHPDPLATHLINAHPATGYEKQSSRWPELAWYDRHTGKPVQVTSGQQHAENPEDLAEAIAVSTVPLRTIGQVLRTHGSRPEHKSLPPNNPVAGPNTTGLLQRRPIRSAPQITALIGKEGNRLLERATGEITDPTDYRTSYTDPAADRWRRLVLPVLGEIRDALGTAHIAHHAGISDRQVRNWLAGRDVPHAGATGNRQRAEQLAADWATRHLEGAGRHLPADPYARLYAYRSTLGTSPPALPY